MSTVMGPALCDAANVCADGINGKRIVKVDPLPTELCTSMRPS